MPLSPSELLRLADLNFGESLREHARWSEQGVIDEREGTLRTLSGTRFPAGMFNTVFPLYVTPREPAAWLRQQLAFFAEAQRGCSIYTRGHADAALARACSEVGLRSGGDSPVMACEAPPGEAPHDARIALEFVHSPDLLHAWIEIQASAFATLGMPEQALRDLMESPARMLGPHVKYLLARYDGAPVAGALALFSHGIAGLYWIGVLPDQRKHGLGEAVTRAITNEAFADGARAVVLQASEYGYPVYESLGYREIGRYPWFIVPRSSLPPASRS